MHFLEGDYYYTKIFCPTTFVITLVTYKNIIYDIGTKILNLQCLNFPQNQLFCKFIFFSGICTIFCALYDGSIKTGFEAICDIFSKICMRPWIRSFAFLRPKRPLRVDLRSNLIIWSGQKAPAGRLTGHL